MSKTQNSTEVLSCLNDIFMAEMGGVMRYLHYSFMIMGHNRIPIQKWFRDKALEGVAHATTIGEKITALGGHPPMEQVKIEESNVHSVNAILTESLSFERHGLELYKKLVRLAGEDIALEELARDFVRQETEHLEEVEKMLKAPGV